MLKDITRRHPAELPDHDLYVAGFPCQPFSTMGSRQGVRDKLGRGLLINHIIATLAAKRPRAFLLENVKGLVLQHRATFAQHYAATRRHRGVRVQGRIQDHKHRRSWHSTASRTSLYRWPAPGIDGPHIAVQVANPAEVQVTSPGAAVEDDAE